MDKASGERQELSDDEYAALSGYADPAAYYAAQGYDPSAAAYDPTAHAWYATENTDQALADYEAAVKREAAYYQGMADYEAMLKWSALR